MKKRYALLLTGLLTLSLAAGCGTKTDNAGETSAPAVSESQAQRVQSRQQRVQSRQQMYRTQQIREKKRRSQEQLMRSKISCLLSQMSLAQRYEFSFETAPEGLENVAGGDTVKVTYTGEISEVDPFNGTVISVEKQ